MEDGQLNQLHKVLHRFSKCFSKKTGLIDLVEYDINLVNDEQVRSKRYRTSQKQTEILKIEIQKMLKLRIIEVGESDNTSPIISVEVPGKDPDDALITVG